MVNDLVLLLMVVVVALASAAVIMVAYRRRRGRLELRYGDASVTYASQRSAGSTVGGVVVQESDVTRSTLDIVRGADARIDSSRFSRSNLVIRDGETPVQRSEQENR